VYYPVFFRASRTDRPVPLGLDLASQPEARRALERARASGNAVATGPAALSLDAGSAPAVEVFLAIYEEADSPEPPAEAAAAKPRLLGFAVGLFRLDWLVREALGDLTMASLTLRLVDVEAGPEGRPLVVAGQHGATAAQAERAAEAPEPWFERGLAVGGRKWRVECTPTEAFFALRQTWQARGLLVLGPLFTVVLALYVSSYVGRTLRVERQVAERTAELRRANARLERAIGERKEVEQTLADERNLLRALIDNMPDYIYVKDTDSRFVLNNDSHVRVLGAEDAEEVRGKSDFDYFPQQLAERYYADEQALIARGEPMLGHEEPVVTPDGEERWVSTTKAPLRDNSGQVVGLVGISRDITEHRQAEEALAREAEVNEALADLSRALLSVDEMEDISAVVLDHARRLTASPLGYVGYIDPETGYLVVPTLTREIWETCQVEGKGTVFQEFVGLWGWVLTERKPLVSNAPREDRRWRGVPEGHMPIERFLAAPATIGTLLVGQVAVANSERDYTEADLTVVERLADLYAIAVWRQRAEEELARTAQELARSNRELEQFASVASHDLQEPLRMVSSFVQLLAERYEGQLDDEADEFIHFAVDGANRMRQLIQDLLVFSRVGTRGQPPAPTDMGRVLDQAVANCQARIEESGAEITRDPLPVALADEQQMVLVFQNLLSNAIKFRGEAPPRIHVSARASGEEWEFAVRDNGIGINPDHGQRIFQIFKRLHTREEYPGTGIGLAICKKTIERHGGRVWVDSQPGQGATFRFTLPQAGDSEP
ncbi:MAG: ATP-binding protein, partial [Planctomycetota bacterium]